MTYNFWNLNLAAIAVGEIAGYHRNNADVNMSNSFI